MSRQRILLLAQDQIMMQRLAQAFASHGLPIPSQFASGERAIEWLELHGSDLCLLDHDLPGVDGLRTLARLHQREPDMPVIMLSSAGTEAAAVAAFRAGVYDYVPKQGDYPTFVARRVREVLTSESAVSVSQPIIVGPDVDDRLRQPSYQNRLRAIGRELDLNEFRAVAIMEVGGGFIVRGTRAGRRVPEALEFLDRDFPQLVAVTSRGEGERKPHSKPLIPTGYEDVFRAVGRRLDEQTAEAVGVMELTEALVVYGLTKVDASAHTTPQPFEWVFGVEDVDGILNEAYRLRQAKPQQPGLLRRLVNS